MIVRVRNLRVAVVLIRDAVTVIIRIRNVRITVTVGVQIEERLSVVLAAIRVSHHDRNIELFDSVLVQLRLVRERNGDLTSVLINRNFVALRNLEAFRNRELRTLRSLDVLIVIVSEGRRRLRFLTRNNQLVFVLGVYGICNRVLDNERISQVRRTVREKHHSGVDVSGLSSVRNGQRARLSCAEVIGGDIALGSDFISGGVVPLDGVRRIRHEANSPGLHRGALESRLVGGVVINNIKARL